MQKQKINCPKCNSNSLIKKGLRKNKYKSLQRYECKDCKKIFIIQDIKHKTYPIKIILSSISAYNLGYTLEKSAQLINKRYNLQITPPTILGWLNEYKEICTYNRLRNQAIKLYKPNHIIHKQTLNHIQPYTFKYHKAKLSILTSENPQFVTLKDYLEKINSKDFPHHIFTYLNENKGNEKRASQLKFPHLKISHIQKQNQANELAKLALHLAVTNKQRHTAIQDFMLINDSTTIAVEIPVYSPITGHIDILQIRNGLLHILDYKPEADKVQPIEQLTVYAMALSRKLNLPLYYLKCAWFDENSYFEFFPLHVVYKKER